MASKDKKPAKSTSVARRPGDLRTLADLNRRSGSDSDSDDDAPPESHIDRDKCEKLVQGSSKCTDVDKMCNRAKQEGAVEGPVASLCTSSSTTFTGIARLLSDGTIVPHVSQPHETVVHNIIFWHDGFSVNDGPIRSLDDPANASFLESIRKSECPKELDPAEKRASINVNLIRRDENCFELQKANIPFQGVGRTLGSSDTSLRSTQPASASSAPPASAPPPCIVDQTRPSTPIQIRLADGTRLVGQFNYHDRISDIRAFIDASMPGGSRTYQLWTVGFPPKELNDLDQTIEQAWLANSVIMQKL